MLDKENVVLIQPVGAIEQHGPHLPLIVDAAIGVAVFGKALEKLSDRSQLMPYHLYTTANRTNTGIPAQLLSAPKPC